MNSWSSVPAAAAGAVAAAAVVVSIPINLLWCQMQ